MFFLNLYTSVFASIRLGFFLNLKEPIFSPSLSNPFLPLTRTYNILSLRGKWDSEELNEQRIKILESARTTKTCKKGVLSVDDSSCKKWGIKTEGAKVQYSGY
jgi:hypothetical protein